MGQQEIINVLGDVGIANARQISNYLNANEHTIRNYLTRMKKYNIVEECMKGRYILTNYGLKFLKNGET